jgi:hypothetical protein
MCNDIYVYKTVYLGKQVIISAFIRYGKYQINYQDTYSKPLGGKEIRVVLLATNAEQESHDGYPEALRCIYTA